MTEAALEMGHKVIDVSIAKLPDDYFQPICRINDTELHLKRVSGRLKVLIITPLGSDFRRLQGKTAEIDLR